MQGGNILKVVFVSLFRSENEGYSTFCNSFNGLWLATIEILVKKVWMTLLTLKLDPKKGAHANLWSLGPIFFNTAPGSTLWAGVYVDGRPKPPSNVQPSTWPLF